LNDTFFFSAPQLKRDPLGSPSRNRMRLTAFAAGLLALACAANRKPAAQRPCAASSSGTSSVVYDTSQVHTKPILATIPQLSYPDRARSEGRQGRVVIAFIINADGRPEPSSVAVLTSLDFDLDRAAADWVRAATFEPACLGGRPVRVRIRMPVDFRIIR
jgi:protein TonB